MLNKVALFFISLSIAFAAIAEIKVGTVPPSYLGMDRSGQEVRLEDLRGKVVIVAFWGTWCSPCLREIPELEAMQRQFGKERLEVVAVNFRETKRALRKARRRMEDYAMTQIYDEQGEITKAYAINVIPYTLVINRQGTVELIHTGYGRRATKELLEQLNDLILSG